MSSFFLLLMSLTVPMWYGTSLGGTLCYINNPTLIGGPVLGLPPPLFYFGGKLKIPKSEKREEKETDHGLTTPPFPSLSFFNAR